MSSEDPLEFSEILHLPREAGQSDFHRIAEQYGGAVSFGGLEVVAVQRSLEKANYIVLGISCDFLNL